MTTSTITNMTTVASGPAFNELFIKITQEGALRIGTCGHCVIHEDGRPKRAWDTDGDKDLDFPRDRLMAYLAELGISAEIVSEFVCP